MTSVQELNLKRFQTTSIKGQKYITIYCSAGVFWITAGKGFDDIVLKAGTSLSIIAKEKIVIEALEDSYASISFSKMEEQPELAFQN